MAPHTGKDSARSGSLKIDAPPPTLAQRILSAKETDSLQAFKHTEGAVSENQMKAFVAVAVWISLAVLLWSCGYTRIPSLSALLEGIRDSGARLVGPGLLIEAAERGVELGGPGLPGVIHVLYGGVIIWGLLFVIILNSPIATSLSTKHQFGPLAGRVDVTDRLCAVTHAIISGSFGIWAWTFVPIGQCHNSPQEERLLRVAVALTTSFLCYDLIMLTCAEAIYRIRDVSWSMWCHHINILVFFFAGLLSNQLAWFMAANLVNEVSTLPLHLTYFMYMHGFSDTVLFKIFAIFLLLGFFTLRVVGIALSMVLLYNQNSCIGQGCDRSLATCAWIVVSIHWALNIYWFAKLFQMMLKKGKAPEDTTDADRVPLIARKSGLGPAAANDDDAPPPTPVGPTGDPLNP